MITFGALPTFLAYENRPQSHHVTLGHQFYNLLRLQRWVAICVKPLQQRSFVDFICLTDARENKMVWTDLHIRLTRFMCRRWCRKLPHCHSFTLHLRRVRWESHWFTPRCQRLVRNGWANGSRAVRSVTQTTCSWNPSSSMTVTVRPDWHPESSVPLRSFKCDPIKSHTCVTSFPAVFSSRFRSKPFKPAKSSSPPQKALTLAYDGDADMWPRLRYLREKTQLARKADTEPPPCRDFPHTALPTTHPLHLAVGLSVPQASQAAVAPGPVAVIAGRPSAGRRVTPHGQTTRPVLSTAGRNPTTVVPSCTKCYRVVPNEWISVSKTILTEGNVERENASLVHFVRIKMPLWRGALRTKHGFLQPQGGHPVMDTGTRLCAGDRHPRVLETGTPVWWRQAPPCDGDSHPLPWWGRHISQRLGKLDQRSTWMFVLWNFSRYLNRSHVLKQRLCLTNWSKRKKSLCTTLVLIHFSVSWFDFKQLF